MWDHFAVGGQGRAGKIAGKGQVGPGMAQEVKARDRDETETLTSRDRDVGFTSRDETL